ncbi:MAG: hypothetical protein H6739_22220 [Alphaproteobacteria bacterium]|nr:hypothetical protein [Alphaproteobacteria bacterium]
MSEPTPQKLETVRSEVRSLLQRSEAFAQLPVERRRQLAHDLVKVGHYLADPTWLSQAPAPEVSAQAAEPLAKLRETIAEGQSAADVQKRLAKDPGQVGQDFKAGAVREGVDQFAEMVQAVDFPQFVSGLIQGVFQAVVDASIQQMEAYGELLSAVSKSVDQFANDHISDAQARDFIANRNPQSVQVVQGQDGLSRLQTRPDQDTDGLARQYNIQNLDLDDDEGEKRLVLAAKMEMARSRQQMMATMVLLGINRIVVTNGRINAKVVFDMRASDEATRVAKASMIDKQETQSQAAVAAWSPWAAGGASRSRKHMTTVTSSVDDTSESKAEVKAKLSGDVQLRFKSETFPLERLADAGGLALLNQRAQPLPMPNAPQTTPQTTPQTSTQTPSTQQPSR